MQSLRTMNIIFTVFPTNNAVVAKRFILHALGINARTLKRKEKLQPSKNVPLPDVINLIDDDEDIINLIDDEVPTKKRAKPDFDDSFVDENDRVSCRRPRPRINNVNRFKTLMRDVLLQSSPKKSRGDIASSNPNEEPNDGRSKRVG